MVQVTDEDAGPASLTFCDIAAVADRIEAHLRQRWGWGLVDGDLVRLRHGWGPDIKIGCLPDVFRCFVHAK